MTAQPTIGQEAETMTTKTTRIPLSTLTAHIREYERDLAPGSETDLWGDYVAWCHETYGAMPWSEEELDVHPAEAAWWVGAYCRDLAVQAGGADPTDMDGESLLPTASLPGDYDAARDLLGRELTDDEETELEAGYRWRMDELRDAEEDR